MSETLPLPPPAFPVLREGDIETACWEVDCYTAEQMLAYAAAAVAQERERCAKMCEEDAYETGAALAAILRSR